jgi:hypothetical protein
MLPVMRKPTAAVRKRYENRAGHARFVSKQKSAAQIVAFCFAKRQTIFRIFRLPLAPAVCGRFSSLAQSRASQTTEGKHHVQQQQ